MISISGNRPRRPIIWDDVRAFLAVARHGTLTAAADALGIGIATLSRRVDRLEDALGIPLFVRQQSGYQLTEEGSELLDRGEAVEQAALAFESTGGREPQLTGRVRLATAENLANGLILPALPKFRRLHPRLMVEVVTDIVTVNVHRRDADLAVRMVKPERGNVTIKRLGTLGYGLYAAPSYVETRSVDTHGGAYEGDEIITWGDAHSHLPAAQWVERVLRGRQPALTTTSLSTQVAATRAGLGMAVLPHFLARDAGLECLESDIGIDQPIYLVMQSNLAQSPRIRTLADFLVEIVSANRTRLRGY
ncbi:LysR family transcriptional regulator [Falsirhodobacter algicola]|uniref:LysR family transcriptional regulator n=1 Tax=Falsirhodobacter algicola TaxID=2692330 RepID=A0A8J8SLF0_9RHOB|nr:LysR family transcriptional regulator [Falsirhodobacter algicola]QUS36344.1 LysR family transcriptional regulator [Falsirhodobacter algicola]